MDISKSKAIGVYIYCGQYHIIVTSGDYDTFSHKLLLFMSSSRSGVFIIITHFRFWKGILILKWQYKKN